MDQEEQEVLDHEENTAMDQVDKKDYDPAAYKPETVYPNKPKAGLGQTLSTLIVIGIAIIIVIGVNQLNLTSSYKQVACTQEAKLCPDGSAVGRTGPNCEFSACPAVNSGLSETEARAIAEKDCIKGGEALAAGIYNEMTKTWWFDANLNATKPGCNPACVVSEATKTAEINWRCTGLIEPNK